MTVVTRIAPDGIGYQRTKCYTVAVKVVDSYNEMHDTLCDLQYPIAQTTSNTNASFILIELKILLMLHLL